MKLEHSFSVPDAEFCVDPEGLVEALLEKVVNGYCLTCKPNSAFATPTAAQQHMIAKSHCAMAYETDEQLDEYSPFFDYGAGSDDGEDGGDEEDEGLGLDGPVVMAGTGRLLLPSGVSLVNRKMLRYSKQYLPDSFDHFAKAQLERMLKVGSSAGPSSSSSASNASSSSASSDALVAAARHGDAKGKSLSASDARKYMTKNDLTKGNIVNIAAQRKSQKYVAREALRTGMSTNMLIRKYFRIQLLQ